MAGQLRDTPLLCLHQWVKISTLQLEVAVRVGLNLETLTLILKPQSSVFLGRLKSRIKIGVSGPIFDTIFMVRVRARVISGYDVTLNISTAVRIQLQTVVWKCSPILTMSVQRRKTSRNQGGTYSYLVPTPTL